MLTSSTTPSPSTASTPFGPKPSLVAPARPATSRFALVFFLAASLIPLVGSAFLTRLAIEAGLLGMLALSVDLLLGRVGMLSLGQASFFGAGAYVAALGHLQFAAPLLVIAIAVVVITTALSLTIGLVAVRLSGVYFALITFGIGEILAKCATNIAAVGGSDGLLGLPPPNVSWVTQALSVSDDTVFFFIVLFLLAGSWLATRRLLHTPFGAVLEGMRDNPSRIPYLGYNPFGYKLVAYVVAANVAALGGMLYPSLRGFVSPVLFGFEFSTKAVVMALVGGLGSLIGPLVGAGVVTFAEDAVSNVTRHHLFAIGALFVAFVLFAPSGLIGLWDRFVTRAGHGDRRA